MVIGRLMVSAAWTHSPTNPYSGVRAGIITAPSIFSLVNASMNRISGELPLSIKTRRTTLSAIQISPINASLCGWSSLLASSSVKVIGVLSWQQILATCSAMFMYSPRSEPPRFADITSPATSGGTSSISTKNCGQCAPTLNH
ncbi:hypothetical protein TIFTF001_023227 [Ficus carica]|uniref:Uncharacterized protein n=1 Tax=Ficus carica TaxID=3494 RepID=A0AA88AK18_FICCA|nr:hypothetical protein TIFTF001_023227 [Ficus carica]